MLNYVKKQKNTLKMYFFCFFRLVFHSLLKPIRWNHPLIFGASEKFRDLLDSPTPFIIGINEVI